MVFLDFIILWFFLLEVTTFGKPQIFTFLWVKPIFFCTVLYIIERERIGEIWGKKCRECSEGKLMWVSGLKLPGEPDMVSHKSDQITHDGVQVIWPKVQGA